MSNNNIIWHSHNVSKKDRCTIKNQKPCIIWLTGLSGSGKSTIANELEVKLNAKGYHTYLLDGDNIRSGLNFDLNFNEKDREENIRRIGEVAKLFVDAGLIVITAFISPFFKDRQKIRTLVEHNEFVEVYVDTPIEICEQRDPKGLYKKVKDGEIKNFTGIDSPYEKPQKADIHLQTDGISLDENVKFIIEYLQKGDYINA